MHTLPATVFYTESPQVFHFLGDIMAHAFLGRALHKLRAFCAALVSQQ